MGDLQTYPASVQFLRKPTAAWIHESWSELTEVPKLRRREFQTSESESTLFALAVAVEQRDADTAGHCERLAFTAVALGVMMELEQTNLLALYRGGFLHDVGKVGIPDSILL